MATNLKQFEAKVKKAVEEGPKAVSKIVWDTRYKFRDSLGTPASTKNTGYKFKKEADPKLLEAAMEARAEFEVIVKVTGKNKDVLRKMDRNLSNADRASVHAALAREAKKKATEEATEEQAES